MTRLTRARLFCSFFFRQVQRHRLMGGKQNNGTEDLPMSKENPIFPQYEEIDDTVTNGDLNTEATPPESQQDQPPSLPEKTNVSHQTNLSPPVPKSRRPSDTPNMGISRLSDQQHPRRASVDTGRPNAYRQRQKRHNSEPAPVILARQHSASPSTSLTEENTPLGTHPSAISAHPNRVYSNMQSSEITYQSNHLPETDMPQTTIDIPQTILEQEDNVQPTVAKIPEESRDEGG